MVQVKPKAKLTYDDYANLPGDERYELIDGELILVASPNEKHQWISKKVCSCECNSPKTWDWDGSTMLLLMSC